MMSFDPLSLLLLSSWILHHEFHYFLKKSRSNEEWLSAIWCKKYWRNRELCQKYEKKPYRGWLPRLPSRLVRPRGKPPNNDTERLPCMLCSHSSPKEQFLPSPPTLPPYSDIKVPWFKKRRSWSTIVATSYMLDFIIGLLLYYMQFLWGTKTRALYVWGL